MVDFYEFYLKLRYGKQKLQRLRDRSFPYVGSVRKLAEMNNAELIRHLRKTGKGDFKIFFKKSISTPTVEEALNAFRNRGKNR